MGNEHQEDSNCKKLECKCGEGNYEFIKKPEGECVSCKDIKGMVKHGMEKLDENKDGKINDEDDLDGELAEIAEFLMEHCDHNGDGSLDGCELTHCAAKYFNEN